MTITGRSQVNMSIAKAAFGRKFSKSPRNLAPQWRNFDEMFINFNQSILMTEVMASIEFMAQTVANRNMLVVMITVINSVR